MRQAQYFSVRWWMHWILDLLNNMSFKLSSLSKRNLTTFSCQPGWKQKNLLPNFARCCLRCNAFSKSSTKLDSSNSPLEMCELAIVDMMTWETYKIFFEVVSFIDTETSAHRSIAPFYEPTYKTCHVTHFFLEISSHHVRKKFLSKMITIISHISVALNKSLKRNPAEIASDILY